MNCIAMSRNLNGDICCNGYGNGNPDSRTSFANSKNNSKSINVNVVTNTNQDKTLSLETVTPELSSMMFEDLRVGSTSITAAAANSADHSDVRWPFVSSSTLQQERRVPTAAYLDSSKDYGSNSNIAMNKIGGDSMPIHPSNRYQSKPTRPQNRRLRTRPNRDHDHSRSRDHDHHYFRTNQVKEPLLYSTSTASDGSTINRKNNEYYPKMELSPKLLPKPLSTLSHLYKTHSQQQQQNKQQLSQHLERVLKPPPLQSLSLSLPSSSPSVLPSLASPSTQRNDSSIPRAIDASPEANPTISLISLSSMFRKKKLAGHYYPSRDSIEEQISKTVQDDLPINAILPSISARDTTPSGSEGNQVAALSSSSIQANPSTRPEIRPCPKKPLRVDSLHHSRLQQQHQQKHHQHQHQHHQQQHQQQQQQPTSQQEYQHPSHTIPHQHQMQQHAFPCPLPVGNGITNGTATRIHNKANASENITIAAQQQEYESKASPPSLSQRKPQQQHQHQHQHQHHQKNSIVNTNDVSDIRIVKRYRNSAHATTNDESPKPSLSAPGPLSQFFSATKVEIYPGVFHALRDSKEITLAKKRNFVVSYTCIVCTAKSLCVADAAYTICPACYAVYPLTSSPLTAVTIASNSSHMQSIQNHHGNTNISDDGRWGIATGSRLD